MVERQSGVIFTFPLTPNRDSNPISGRDASVVFLLMIAKVVSRRG